MGNLIFIFIAHHESSNPKQNPPPIDVIYNSFKNLLKAVNTHVIVEVLIFTIKQNQKKQELHFTQCLAWVTKVDYKTKRYLEWQMPIMEDKCLFELLPIVTLSWILKILKSNAEITIIYLLLQVFILLIEECYDKWY